MAARGADDQHRKGRQGRRPGTTGTGGRPAPVAAARTGRRRRRAGGSVLAALGSLLVLLVLLLGVPALLGYGTLAVAGMGDPVGGSVTDALTSPDDGRLFLWALVAVGWLAWLCFLLAVLIEIPAQLRGRVARRIPAFGWSQRLAAGLVGSVIVLLPVAGSAFAATPELPQRAPAVAQLTAAPAIAALPAAAPAAAPAADPQQPVYTVRDTRPADSLWSIAERQLGSGERWTEIAKLNDGRPMDDSGTRFDADRPIQPGWRLLMPADAKPDAAAASSPQTGNAAPAPAAAPAHGSVTVKPGDSLSGIAQRELGDGDRWPEFFAANKGVTAPDGEKLTDPDVLAPGTVLTVPGTAPAPAPQPPAEQTPAPQPPAEPAPAASAPATPEPSAPAASAPAASAPAVESPAPAASPAPESVPAGAPAQNLPAVRTGDSAPGPDYTVPLVASGIGVLMAAALIGVVARRRTDQQRARRPRHRIALPSAAAGRFEAELKARQNTDGLELLNRALRTLGRNTVRGGKRLPALVAARITTGGTVELHLAAPAVPIAPFRAAHAPNVWWCPEDANDLLSVGQAAKYAAPYPALVTLGSTPDGSTVLADLETVRLVHLSGHPEDTEDVLRTLAVELAHSPLADRLHLHLVGFAPDLPAGGPATDRVHHHTTLEAALTALGPRTAKARATLVAAEAGSPREARSRGSADEAWVPEIVLSAQPPAGNIPAELGRLLDGRPRTCLAVLTRAPERGAGPVARWTLPATGPATLPGLHLTVELQRLSREEYDHLGELVRASGDFTQHPAPDWTLDGPHNGPDDEAELPLPVPALAAVGAAIGASAGDLPPATAAALGVALDDPTPSSLDTRVIALLGAAAAASTAPLLPEPPTSTGRRPSPTDSGPGTQSATPGGDEAGPRLLARVIPTGNSPFAGTAPTNPYAVLPVVPAQPTAPHTFPTQPPTNPYALPPGATPPPAAPAAPEPSEGAAHPSRHIANGQARKATTPPGGTPVDPRSADVPSEAFDGATGGAERPAADAPFDPLTDPLDPRLLGYPAADTPSEPPALPPVEATAPADPFAAGPAAEAPAVPFPAAPAPAPVDPFAAAPTPDAPSVPLAAPADPRVAGFPAAVPAVAPAVAEPLPTHDQAQVPHPHAANVPARPAPRPGTAPARSDSDDLLAILRSPEAHHLRSAPRIRLLGPVDILGAAGTADAAGRARLTELAAYLALRPGTEHTTLDRDIHPGAAHLDPRATAERLAEPLPVKLAALAAWLGSSTEGRAFLEAQPAETYSFAPAVSCDWDEFRSLYRRGMRSTSSTADAALAHALALVRGAPFAEAPAGAFGWAETERQDMLAAIVDTAHELAARRLQYGDHRTAEAAIFRALAVAPDVELLHRDLFYAYASAGARDQLVRAVNRLDALSRRTGRDLDPDTVALLRDLLTGG
ncbi:LysM peptidoglycan-binding domain-containing protein [Kitasatospora sp. NPDC049285]|uniref:LysM peptidoglycan-binding domain-containing protein n=1 Tax=Kitasatospora sp. NPDC049285 TaxID=3157096 RepID=UPI00341D30F7